MNLNFNFNAKTLLSEWWTIVRDNLKTIQSEFNAHIDSFNAAVKRIDADIEEERSARTSEDTALSGRISAEESARTQADTALSGRISAEESARTQADTALSGRISDEESARTQADTALGGRIDAEETKRSQDDARIRSDFQAADAEINNRVGEVAKKTHTHENKDVLDMIDSERVSRWDEKSEGGVKQSEFELYREYIETVIRGAAERFAELWRALGVVFFDGGIFGVEQTDAPLDGGLFEDTELTAFDCGGFEPAVLSFTEAVLDGGKY